MTGIEGSHSPKPGPKHKKNVQKMREYIIILNSTLSLILIHMPVAGIYEKLVHWAGIWPHSRTDQRWDLNSCCKMLKYAPGMFVNAGERAGDKKRVLKANIKNFLSTKIGVIS